MTSLPAAIDDYVDGDNPVRVIDAYIDGLDLSALGFARPAPNSTGRPMYNPKGLLKLYVYGYMNRIRSSRRLEKESRRNLEAIWLLRRLSPDHKTISRFRSDNAAALKNVYEGYAGELERTGERQKLLTAPESRLMVGNGSADVDYNVQTAVGSKNKLAVEFEVTNSCNDSNRLAPMAAKAKEALGAGRRCACKCTKNRVQRHRVFMAESAFSADYDDKNIYVKQIRVAADKELVRRRKAIAEHPFGTIKRGMDAGYCLTKGIEKVRGEFSLAFLAYGLKRVINILGARELISCMAAA